MSETKEVVDDGWNVVKVKTELTKKEKKLLQEKLE